MYLGNTIHSNTFPHNPYATAIPEQYTPEPEVKIVCIPNWIARAFERSKIGLAECTDYQKTRKMLSLDDIKDWQYLNDNFIYRTDKTKSWTERFASIYLEQLFSNFRPEDKEELRALIYQAQYPSSLNTQTNGLDDSTIGVQLSLRLSQPAKSHESKGYRIVAIQKTIWVILEGDFFTQLKKPDIPLIFITELLKNCYIHMSVPEVSSLAVFRTYLEMLSSDE